MRDAIASLLTAGLLAATALGCSTGSASAPVGRPLPWAHRAVPGQILVTVSESAPWGAVVEELSGEYGLETVASWSMTALGVRCVLFQVPDSRPAEKIVRSLSVHPGVELAQLNQVFRALADDSPPARSGDPFAELQYAADRLGLEAAHAWSIGEGVEIAVVDTGVDVTHPELREQITVARNFVRENMDEFTGDGHGTAVAGVVAAAVGNGEGIVGVAPGARLRALKACWYADRRRQQAQCTTYTLAQALDYSVSERVDIVNLSIGGPRDPLLERLVRSAVERGILVVTAAGDPSRPFPAVVDGVLEVWACDAEGKLWLPEANASPATDSLLMAPGAEVLTLVPRGGYDFLSGSSLAAAHVTGIAALLLARQPELTPAELVALLSGTAVAGADGRPVAHACAALARLLDRGC